MKRLKDGERGVSNVIVVMLSLILIIVIVSNVVLWSYQMNQLDWERIQEDIEITDVTCVTNSSWFVAQTEYKVDIGDRVDGNYTDTQAIDDRHERFTESWNWWDANYSYRRRVTVVNNLASMLDMGYSVSVTMDTTSLVSAGKMLSGGNDLRVVHWGDGGWVELDRDIVGVNTTSTQVWFKTQASIDSFPASDNNYYLYYGNPSATNPPSNKNNVYVWFDDFSANTLENYDKEKWVDIHGGTHEYVSPIYDAGNKRVWFDTGDNHASDMYPKGVTEADFLMEVDFWANGSYPTDATVALVGRLENPSTSSTHYYLDFSHENYDSPGITVDSWVNGERSNTVYSEASDYYWDFNTVHTFRYATFGNVHKFWWNKDTTQPPDVKANDSQHTSPGRIGLAPAQVRGWWDNLKIRRYIEPEPTTSLGSEESEDLHHRLEIDGTFVIDVSLYPLANVQTVEIQLRYRANDTLERWYIKAYNWTGMAYGDFGFNNTSGHTPTTEWDWDTYAVNLTDKWRSYISESGTMHLKLRDEGGDSNQTTIDIDLLAVMVVINGVRLTFQNRGSLTSHLVSLWVNNSTHHQRCDVELFINSGYSSSYILNEVSLPEKPYLIKVVTERGNTAVFTGH